MTLAQLEGYVFVTDLNTQNYYMVERDGEIWQPSAFPEAFFVKGRRENVIFNWKNHITSPSKWQWLKGYLPILEISDDKSKLEIAVINDVLQIRLNESEIILGNVSSEVFSQTIKDREKYWETFFAKGWQPPHETNYPDFAWKACFVQAISSFCGLHPKYGVGYYGRNYHDGFPPTIIHLSSALLEYGHDQEAFNYLEYYLKRFLMPDGTIDYYGPSLAEYGMILNLFYKISECSEGLEWCRDNFRFGESISRYLYRSRNNFISKPSKERLLAGVPEADTRDEVAVYTHINAWAWRGLSSWAKTEEKIGKFEAAVEARREAEDIYKRLKISVAEKTERSGIVPFRLDMLNKIKSFEQDRNIIYANYRYYPELLQTGFLEANEVSVIIQAREQLGGELEGMTFFNFAKAWPGLDTEDYCFNNWPLAAYAEALADMKDKQRLKRLLDGHFKYHQNHDTFTAYENVDADVKGIRRAFTDFCVPVQLLFPRALKWYSEL